VKSYIRGAAIVVAVLVGALAAPANASTFSWNYSGTGFFGTGTDIGSGTLTTGALAPTCGTPPACSYQSPPGNTITGITGTWDGFTITGLVAPGLLDLNNNVLYLSPNQTLLDASVGGQPGGLAFFVSNYTGNNVPVPTDVVVELFFDTTLQAYAAVTANTSFGCCSLATAGDFIVTPVNATPLPAALPLFSTGLGALGLLGWRRKKKAAIAAA
jgi:hypothetical protein